MTIKGSKSDHYAWRKDATSNPYRLGHSTAADSPQFPTAIVGGEVRFRWIVDVPLTHAAATADFTTTHGSSGFALSGANYLDLLTWLGPLETDNTGRKILLFTEVLVGWGGKFTGNDGLDAAGLDLTVWTFTTNRAAKTGSFFTQSLVVSATDHMSIVSPVSSLRDCYLDGSVDTKFGIKITNAAVSDIQPGKLIILAKAQEL